MAVGDVVKEPREILRHPGVAIDNEGHVVPYMIVMGELPNGMHVPCGVKNNGDGTYSLMVDAKFEPDKKVQLHANIDFSSASPQTIIAAPGPGNL